MELDNFQKSIAAYVNDFYKALSTPSGDFSVKGFIDVEKTFIQFLLIQK